MQFAGQRTNDKLEPIGEPVNVLIKLAADVLPDPDAVMLTGITPQATIAEGLTEAEFLDYFYKEVFQPNTTFLGFNSVRFDDEFMRYLHYRNFYDPYEWHWTEGCSRWDVLDLVRMTRALRPEGINWPESEDGRPTNRLELLTKLNGLAHDHAHDALSDVHATIAVAKMIRDKQPDLFNYLLNVRNKRQVAALMDQGQPFVYTSGRFGSDHLNTTVATLLGKHTQRDEALVYDLRYDPTPFLTMSTNQLIDAWSYKKDRQPDDPRLPVKTIKYNRCPAVAPLGVLNEAAQQRLELTLDIVKRNLTLLKANQTDFAAAVTKALQVMDEAREQADVTFELNDTTVDGTLYQGFIGDQDRRTIRALRVADPADMDGIAAKLADKRLRQLVPLYKARNYPQALSADERQAWEAHVARQLFDGPNSRLAQYFARLQALAKGTLSSQQEFLIEELQLYGESIMPSDAV